MFCFTVLHFIPLQSSIISATFPEVCTIKILLVFCVINARNLHLEGLHKAIVRYVVLKLKNTNIFYHLRLSLQYPFWLTQLKQSQHFRDSTKNI